MAERYQVRGRRIWDSETDTYSQLLSNLETTETWTSSDDHLWTFKPLADWQDDKPASDPVNHPDHYQGKVECIDAIESALGDDGFVACCRGNAMKYLYRAGRKGKAMEDLRKAAWYINRAIETLSK